MSQTLTVSHTIVIRNVCMHVCVQECVVHVVLCASSLNVCMQFILMAATSVTGQEVIKQRPAEK
jgi:hypothetical protein